MEFVVSPLESIVFGDCGSFTCGCYSNNCSCLEFRAVRLMYLKKIVELVDTWLYEHKNQYQPIPTRSVPKPGTACRRWARLD